MCDKPSGYSTVDYMYINDYNYLVSRHFLLVRCRDDFNYNYFLKKVLKQGRDEFRHNHYPMLTLQLFKFSFERCAICRVMIVSEFIHHLVLVLFIGLKSSL